METPHPILDSSIFQICFLRKSQSGKPIPNPKSLKGLIYIFIVHDRFKTTGISTFYPILLPKCIAIVVAMKPGGMS